MFKLLLSFGTRIASALGAVRDGDKNVPDRTGNRHPALAMAPYNTYRCRDGYVAIFTSAERHWVSMCEMLGRQDLLTNPEFMTTPGRAKNMAVIDDMVGAWTLPKTKDEVLAWAWRIPFVLGGVFGLLAVWLRRYLAETPVFEELRRRRALVEGLPLRRVLAGHRREVVTSMGLTWMLTAGIVVVGGITRLTP